MKILEQIIPEIWNAAVRQQYLKGTIFFGFAFIALLITIFIFKEEEKNNKIVGSVFIIITSLLFIFSLAYFINSEYFAYKALLP